MILREAFKMAPKVALKVALKTNCRNKSLT